MQFSTSQIDAILERTAQILAERIEETRGSLAEMTVFELRTAAQIVGLSTKQIPLYLPITKTAAGKHGVTIGAIRRHIESRTASPNTTQTPRTSKA
jgi:Trk K+ transport system NAD-binding subunit